MAVGAGHIALAVNALGMKTGGGANTERLFKYGAVTKIMRDMGKHSGAVKEKKGAQPIENTLNALVITDIIAYEEPTNAGIPTVGVEVHVGVPESDQFRKMMTFSGATPLGTSAGVGEAIHLIDSVINPSPIVEKFKELFIQQPDRTYRFAKNVTEIQVNGIDDEGLKELWQRTQRYNGKGCQNAVDNVLQRIAPLFKGKRLAELGTIVDIDRALLKLELETSRQIMGDIPDDHDQQIVLMQRKGVLGMNAILSISLAISRLLAHVQGKGLWRLMRDTMKNAMAEMFIDRIDTVTLPDSIRINKQDIKDRDNTREVIVAAMSLEEMVEQLRSVATYISEKKKPLHQAIRNYISVYRI